MSEHSFEDRLASYLDDYFRVNPPKPGDILAVKFHSSTLTDRFTNAFLKLCDKEGPPVGRDSEDRAVVPVYSSPDGALAHVARVVPSSHEGPLSHHEVTQGFATRLRNEVSESVHDGNPRAALMIMEDRAVLDTLEASEELFSEDGPLGFEDFRTHLLDPETCESAPGRAVLGAVNDVIESELADPDDPQVLETLCKLRDAVDDRNEEQLADLVSELPGFIREDLFRGDWFGKTESEEDLRSAAQQTLEDNQKHASEIQRAFQVGRDTTASLESNYERQFVEEVMQSSDWRRVSHADARKFTKTEPTPQFEDLEVDVDLLRVYSHGEDDSRLERSIIGVPDTGQIKITLKFTADLDGVPMEILGADGDAIADPAIDGSKVDSILKNLPADQSTFAVFNLYVGKETTSGTPTHQFKIAAVPEWFFHASESVSWDIDVHDEHLVAHGVDEMVLDPPESFSTEDEEREVRLTSAEGTSVVLDAPLRLVPDAGSFDERLPFTISPPDKGRPVPAAITLEIPEPETSEVTLPLMLSAMTDPDNWADKRLLLPEKLEVDTDQGKIHTPGAGGIGLEEEALLLLQAEAQMVEEGSIHPRKVRGEKVGPGSLDDDWDHDIPAELASAYEDLFDHFRDGPEIPSTDPWDEETQERVQDVLDAYIDAVAALPSDGPFLGYEILRALGTIRSESVEKVWLTPFHPIMLAYALRVAKWRDKELVPGDHIDGFRSPRFLSALNPTGLLPYRLAEDQGQLLRGIIDEHDALWAVYSPVSAPGSETPQYLDRVVRDKLTSFVEAFPILFRMHPDRTLAINLINMGDLEPFIEGLFGFYGDIDDLDVEPPRILLRVYGGPAHGEALDEFFSEYTESRLRERLEKRNDEIVDTLRSRVTYIHEGPYSDDTHQTAHVTFFRGLLEERMGVMSNSSLPPGLLADGLFPRESIDVKPNKAGTLYTVGFASDPDDTGRIHRIARIANALEAGLRNSSYQPNQALKKDIHSKHRANLADLWEDSLWVIHVQPNVGIDFYIEPGKTQDSEDLVMIHYSDQYDASSPDFDVITSTKHRAPYLEALENALRKADLHDVLNPQDVLSRLVAVDGELALEIHRAKDTKIQELIGFIGGLGFSHHLLTRTASDHVWVPISLREFARHDRSHRGRDEGLLQYRPTGFKSDDLCFVGIPKDPSDDRLQLWVVETKGGSASIKKGRKQVRNAREELEEIFHPDRNFADQQILYGEFGKVVVDLTRRMRNYGVLTAETEETVRERERSLLEGEYEIEFLEDQDGHIGEVVRVREGTLETHVDLDHRVRSIEVPRDAMKVLAGHDAEKALPDLRLDRLAFQLPTETTNAASQSEEAPPESEPDEEEKEQSEEDISGTEPEADQGVGPQPSDTSGPSDSPTTDPGSQTPPDPTPERVAGDHETGDETSEGSEEKDDAPPPDDSELYRLAEAIPELQSSPAPEMTLDKGKLVTDIKEAFDSMGVKVHPPNPTTVSMGPRKLGVDVHPKKGQKIEGILRNLGSLSVHVQAQGEIVGSPDPAEGAVRLEIPHDDPQDIYLREALEALRDEIDDAPLTIPLGVDTRREHYALPLLKERHALIAGATGSGKSNFLSTVVASLAVTHSPDEVALSILDPKGIDFGRFAKLPHVEAGAYHDTPEASTAYLHNVLDEIYPERKELLREAGAANLQEYNQMASEQGFDRLPYLVILIDEYADLIMSLDESQDDFEKAVTRIAQVGRAAGIVMLLATQRPSADIVSGKIKANFPCRISFKLPSNTDSRVILDKPGAENLQGAGDMMAITQSQGELHLQGYRLTPKDAQAVLDLF